MANSKLQTFSEIVAISKERSSHFSQIITLENLTSEHTSIYLVLRYFVSRVWCGGFQQLVFKSTSLQPSLLFPTLCFHTPFFSVSPLLPLRLDHPKRPTPLPLSTPVRNWQSNVWLSPPQSKRELEFFCCTVVVTFRFAHLFLCQSRSVTSLRVISNFRTTRHPGDYERARIPFRRILNITPNIYEMIYTPAFLLSISWKFSQTSITSQMVKRSDQDEGVHEMTAMSWKLCEGKP